MFGKKINKIHRKTPVLESLCWSPTTLLNKRLQHRCFPVNIARFLRTHFFIEHLRWLLLQVLLLISCKIYLITTFSCKQKSSNSLPDLRASTVHKLPNEVKSLIGNLVPRAIFSL